MFHNLVLEKSTSKCYSIVKFCKIFNTALEIDFYKSCWKKGTQDVTSTKGCVFGHHCLS